ncbi:ras-related and estrogen-regulated growth inhibitor-like [Anneissia japonica]|uniref:ras-related and estrogen-regulated growth inhibitor-like n=1 Tax=Anneissia japonica TaxID=1529436 RepID=UPI0014258074|nr:ras-related and estrogen-regulated growth inhibitor-like [Anneissia japonica]
MIRLSVPAPNHGGNTVTNTKISECKLVVLGNSSVGKSGRFEMITDDGDDDNHNHNNNDETGDNHREGQIRWGEGFLVIYSVTDRRSFDGVLRIKNYLDEVKKARNVSMVILANKTDLEHNREVSYEEGEKLAEDLACAFFETSVCLGDRNGHEAFYELVREVRRRKTMDNKQRRKSSTSQQMKQVLKGMFTKINNIH